MIVDISQFQGAVNWDAFAGTNPELVIIRAGWGVGGRDSQFQTNWSQAKQRGIKRIAYWFCYPAYNSAQAEANDFNSVVGSLGPGEGMAGDFEDDPGAHGWPADGLAWAVSFLTATGGPNYIPGFYGAPTFLATHNLASLADTWWMWIADWSVQAPNTLGKKAALWQYTDCASVAGVSGCVDASYPLVPVDNLLVGGKQEVMDLLATDPIVQEFRAALADLKGMLADGQRVGTGFDATTGVPTYTQQPTWPFWLGGKLNTILSAITDVKTTVSNLAVPVANLQPIIDQLTRIENALKAA